MQALKRGHLETVQLLVQAGASAHRKNRAGVTPLVLACYRGLMEAVRVLVEAGLSGSKQNNHKPKPLRRIVKTLSPKPQNTEILFPKP